MKKVLLLLVMFSFMLTACSNQIQSDDGSTSSEVNNIVIDNIENNDSNDDTNDDDIDNNSKITTHPKTNDEFNFVFEDIKKMVIINNKGENEIEKSEVIFNLVKEAANTDNIPSKDFVAAFTTVKVYFKNGKSAELGTLFSDEEGNMYLVSDYNNNPKAALLVEDKNTISIFLLPNY